MTCDRCHKKIKGAGMMMPTGGKEKKLCMKCSNEMLDREEDLDKIPYPPIKLSPEQNKE